MPISKPTIICAGFFANRHKTLVAKLQKEFAVILFSADGQWPGMNHFEIKNQAIDKKHHSLAAKGYGDFITAIEDKFDLQAQPDKKNDVIQYFLRLWMQCYYIQGSLLDFHSKQPIAAIIVVNDHLAPMRTLVNFGKKNQIPTFYIEHGFIIASFTADAYRVKENPPVPMADFLCVDNELLKRYYTDYYADRPVQPEICVTGNPVDGILTSGSLKKINQPGKATILYCPSWFEANSLQEIIHGNSVEQKAWLLFCAMIKKLSARLPEPDLEVVVKLHPTLTKSIGVDPSAYYAKIASDFKINLVQIADDPIQNWLARSDLIVTSRNSSVSWEAFLCQVPCITYASQFYKNILKPGKWRKPTYLSDWGIQVYLDDQDDWSLTAAQLIENHKSGEFARLCEKHQSSLAYIDPAEASGNVARLILAKTAGVENQQKKKQDQIRVSKFKILQVIHDFPPRAFSGTEIYTLNFSKELQKLGHDVTVLYPVRDNTKAPYTFTAQEYDGVKVVQFNTYGQTEAVLSDFLNTSFDQPFKKFLTGSDFDVVHFQHLYGLSANWIEIAVQQGLLVFLKIDDMFFFCRQVHLMQNGRNYCSGPESVDKCFQCLNNLGDDAKPEDIAQLYYYLAFRRAVLRKVFKQVHLIHSPSQFLKRICQKDGFDNEHFYVIQTGISPFNVVKKTHANKLRIAYLGEIHFRKGIICFVEAIRLFNDKSKKQAHKIEFKIYGNHLKDNMYQSMLAAVSQVEHVEYLGGFTPHDRSQIFSEIDLLVMPSLGENYPFILREALYAGVPVIATRIAGVPEIVDDGNNGFLIPPGDANFLADLFVKISESPGIIFNLSQHFKEVKLISEEAKEIEALYFEFYQNHLDSLSDIEKRFRQSKALINENRIEAGLKLLSKVLSIAPQHQGALRLLGDVYFKLGKHEEAQQMWSMIDNR